LKDLSFASLVAKYIGIAMLKFIGLGSSIAHNILGKDSSISFKVSGLKCKGRPILFAPENAFCLSRYLSKLEQKSSMFAPKFLAICAIR